MLCVHSPLNVLITNINKKYLKDNYKGKGKKKMYDNTYICQTLKN